VRRHDHREVELETEAGPLRVGLWTDKWVIAWRLYDSEEAEEVFDVRAREAEDLVPPLVRIGMTEQAARALALELIAERAVMDEEESDSRLAERLLPWQRRARPAGAFARGTRVILTRGRTGETGFPP